MKKINLKSLFRRKNKTEDIGHSVAWPVNFIRDWKIMVLIFAIGLASLSFLAWQIYLSDRIGGGYLTPELPPSNISIKTVDEKKLQAGLLMLENKQIDYLKLQAEQTKLVDPSL